MDYQLSVAFSAASVILLGYAYTLCKATQQAYLRERGSSHLFADTKLDSM